MFVQYSFFMSSYTSYILYLNRILDLLEQQPQRRFVPTAFQQVTPPAAVTRTAPVAAIVRPAAALPTPAPFFQARSRTPSPTADANFPRDAKEFMKLDFADFIFRTVAHRKNVSALQTWASWLSKQQRSRIMKTHTELLRFVTPDDAVFINYRYLPKDVDERHGFLENTGRVARAAVQSFVDETLPILNQTLTKPRERSAQKTDLGNLSNVREKTDKVARSQFAR